MQWQRARVFLYYVITPGNTLYLPTLPEEQLCIYYCQNYILGKDIALTM